MQKLNRAIALARDIYYWPTFRENLAEKFSDSSAFYTNFDWFPVVLEARPWWKPWPSKEVAVFDGRKIIIRPKQAKKPLPEIVGSIIHEMFHAGGFKHAASRRIDETDLAYRAGAIARGIAKLGEHGR
ncbi:MAG: hypothetical protein NDJ89_09585 [Oligoflexia bacterium]|nr:hypothetical protein [Oligoflexia bacterium]